ncbi:hypothetical protein CPG38_11435 [Malaciobacter marinus]|uniref:P-loop NTPase fold protein n=1 Tax=Malaciobacter marinus TaxID=505249 RepID=UPI000C0785F3|nr:P-loop NTPase fold protein [Malaciobacter marinus]PHO11756.1 hypothetical protein CPG38_11435 [Malaciobacter marinus]
MANQKVLEEYLVDKENGYLRKSDNNRKVIMLSGKWGSGKTHFWQKKIVPKLNEEDTKIPNHYVSLYGKTSIDEIKNEVFLKVFESVDSFELKEKTNKLVKNTTKLVSSVSKTITVFGVNVDLTKVSDKPFDKLDEILENKKLEKTQEHLNNGAIICFDDFERKSKEINLNDLFGFITQLSLNFECKIVIILNDDVFEGKEKDIFSNVKEKTVSKYLYYKPSIKELFALIFDSEEKYKDLEKHRELIVNTIEETQELNARIYIQVLDNLLEWVEKSDIGKSENFIKYFILVNINFILNHHIFYAYIKDENIKGIQANLELDYSKIVGNNPDELSFSINSNISLIDRLSSYINEADNIVNLKNIVAIKERERNKKADYADNSAEIQDFIENYKRLVKSFIYFKKLDFDSLIESKNEAECEIFNKISNFIETGILIKDENN